MKLNHIDLQVSNVSRARAFFEEHFDFRCTFQRREQLAIMEDDEFSFGVSNLFDSVPPSVSARLSHRIHSSVGRASSVAIRCKDPLIQASERC